MNHRRPRPVSVAFHWSLPLAFSFVLAALATAQTRVSYGQPARMGNITNALQNDRYLLAGAQGDTLRVTFSSRSVSGPYYLHRLEVLDSGNPIGTPIDGLGTLTVTLPRTTDYTISVRARNNQDTGWYAFQVDRLNNPVGADRIAFNWTMTGTRLYPNGANGIPSAAAFAVHTLRAVAGSKGVLRFTSRSVSGPYYVHYAELLDATGQRLARVDGTGFSPPIDFQTTGVYTLFVAARNWQDTGWYAASVDCNSWPGTPCDDTAHSSNYGNGWPVNRVPTLTATARPVLGTMSGIDIGNSSGMQTTAFILFGIDTQSQMVSGFGCTVLVKAAFVLGPLTLPPGGQRLTFAIPNVASLSGLGFAVQSLVVDPNAMPGQLACSPGLLMLLGSI